MEFREKKAGILGQQPKLTPSAGESKMEVDIVCLNQNPGEISSSY